MSHRYSVPPMLVSDTVLDDVQVALQHLSPRPVSREMARESVYNLARFFDVLQRWDAESSLRKQHMATAGDPTGSSTDQREEP